MQMELIEKERERARGNDDIATVVDFYYRRQVALIDTWERDCGCEIIPALKQLEECGKLNLLTCVGTHPFLPAYQSDVQAIRLQLGVTVRAFEEAFGRRPRMPKAESVSHQSSEMIWVGLLCCPRVLTTVEFPTILSTVEQLFK